MRSAWRWMAGAAILAMLVQQWGSTPFVRGVSQLDVKTLVLGGCLAAVTTGACAWRWCLVAKQLDVELGVPAAFAACYRSQFLNTILPCGVAGDIHRGVVHGRAAGATGLALRAVWWERFAGQVVQAALTVAVLLLLPSPAGRMVPWWGLVAVAVLLGALLAAGRISVARTGTSHRVLRTLHHDVGFAVLGRRSWPGILAASTLAIGGHVVTFLLAARAVGITVPLSTLLPISMLVLAAAGLPLNLGGWGPREGMAAATFAAAGIGAEQGVAAAVAFGAMVFVANLPGMVVLLVSRHRSTGFFEAERRSPGPPQGLPAGGAHRA